LPQFLYIIGAICSLKEMELGNEDFDVSARLLELFSLLLTGELQAIIMNKKR